MRGVIMLKQNAKEMTIARRKLEIAGHKIKTLEECVERQVNCPESKAILKARFSERNGKHQIYIAEVPDLHDFAIGVSIEIGMIVHLLRSSLDNQVFDLALVHSKGLIPKPQTLQFPIITEKTIPEGQVRFMQVAHRSLNGISTRAISSFETFQPYHGIAGRPDSYSGTYIHQLSLLQELSNLDKHRTVATISVDPNRFEFHEPATLIDDAHHKWMWDNREEYFHTFTPALMECDEVIEEAVVTNLDLSEPVFAGYAIASVALEERRPFASTLTRIKHFVGAILDDTDQFL